MLITITWSNVVAVFNITWVRTTWIITLTPWYQKMQIMLRMICLRKTHSSPWQHVKILLSENIDVYCMTWLRILNNNKFPQIRGRGSVSPWFEWNQEKKGGLSNFCGLQNLCMRNCLTRANFYRNFLQFFFFFVVRPLCLQGEVLVPSWHCL